MPVFVGADRGLSSILNDTIISTTANTTLPMLASMSMSPTLSALSTLAEFLLGNAKIILSKPVNGNLQLARFLFITWYENKKAQYHSNNQKKSKNRSKNRNKKALVAAPAPKSAIDSITDVCSWEAFLKCLIELKGVAKYSFSLKGSGIYGLNDNDIKRLQNLLEIHTTNRTVVYESPEGVKGSSQGFHVAEWSDLEFEFLDEFELRILLNKLNANSKGPPKGNMPNNDEKRSSTSGDSAANDDVDSNDFEKLMDILDVKPTSNTRNVSKRYASNNQNFQMNEHFNHANYEPHYELIYDLLSVSTARQILAAEKHALTTPKKPFLNICNNHNHCYQVGAIAQFASPSSGGGDERSFNNNGNDRRGASGNSSSNSLNSFNNIEIKIDKKSFAKLPSDVKACLNAKIHFIPIIKSSISKQKAAASGPGAGPMGVDDKTFFNQYSSSVHHHSSQTLIANAQGSTQTDLSLGDCSYLDTCYKLNSCRYVHYYKLLPVEELNREIVRCEQFNNTISDSERVSDFCWNESFGSYMQSQLPAQWINCDVNKFDFDVLGKFSAIVADPAWNIHMNLPYGASNDKELSGLPIPQLQDEGIMFLWVTGRAIELGKSCLSTWGYKNINEIIWIKTNQLNRTICTGRTGHWLNHSKEHLLVGIKGNPKWLQRGSDVDIIVSSTRETSRKPDELYGIVERLVGKKSRKLEIFGRQHNTRPGWFTIGNQLNGINIYEKEVARKYAVFQGSKNSNGSNAFRK